MHVTIVSYQLGSLKQALSVAQLEAICVRVLGSTQDIETIEELPGGTINTVYLLHRTQQPTLVLRIAPSEQHPMLFSHEHRLLPREYAAQPYLAPVGNLLPDIVFVDFTNQLIERDYMVQTAIAGDVWRDVRNTLPHEEQDILWRQFGTITRQIQQMQHPEFGPPHVQPGYARWSDVLLADLHATMLDFKTWSLETRALKTVYAFVADQRSLFDFMSKARLLHGDLWLNNLLVRHTPDGPRIVGVLDAGFAQWGDPAADWTIMRMVQTTPKGGEAFWDDYGRLETDPDSTLRSIAYQARMFGWALLELARRQDAKLPQVVQEFEALCGRLGG